MRIRNRLSYEYERDYRLEYTVKPYLIKGSEIRENKRSKEIDTKIDLINTHNKKERRYY